MKNALRNLFLIFTIGVLQSALVATPLSAQGVTTSEMRGLITDEDGNTLIGANVIAVHQPTGSQYGTSTDIEGRYRMPNMKIGGPYTISVSYTGYEEKSVTDIYLSLGEPKKIDFQLGEGAIELQSINVIAKRGSAGENSGASTQIGRDQIESLPTLDRGLNDFTRLTPQARESFGGGFTVAGVNNRYNAIYFDGAVNNDVFGLAASGTNGGQTGTAPISIDAIDQIQVVVSPYDVSYGGFAGGGINAVTKSGTNKFEGGLYYFMQNEGLAGKTNATLAERAGSERTKLAEFSNTLYGLNLSGPIVKDKVFFFINAEIQNEETPLPFEIGDYQGNLTATDLNDLRDYLINQYDYDPGDYGAKTNSLEANRFFAKVNWNINQDHKLTLRHNYVKGVETAEFGSGSRSINYRNNGIYFPSTTNSSALELSSRFGNGYSNNLTIGYTSVRDDRDPIGEDFPAVTIEDANGAEVSFGSEPFSTANQLDQDVFTITDNFKIYRGDHTITIGTHNEFISFYNLFIRQNFGAYEYSNIDDFYNNAEPSFYTRSYSLVDDVVGDGSEAAAEFDAMQLGFYLQDEWSVSNKFTLTGGIRLDVPMLTDDPEVHESFNSETLPMLAEHYDLEGAMGGEAPQGQLMWSPRIGFNYDVNNDNTTILRGGVGVFTSRIPFVWPGGMYTNNGITVGGFNNFQVEFPIEFIADIDEQYTNPNITVPSGQIDLFTEDFKYPQVFRTSLALDNELGDGWYTSLEGIYTKTLNNVLYTNVNTNSEVDYNWTNGGDERPVFVNETIDNRYQAVYLASNTNEGYTYTLTGQLQKRFDFGLDLMAAYSYGDAYAVFEGTSSQNSSQWRGAFHVDGRNNASFGRSDFSLGSRFIANANYGIDWDGSGNFKTSFNIFYEGVSGQPYSYVYDEANINRETGSTSRERTLIYVPEDEGDINLVDIEDGPSAQDQWEALNQFIEEDDYLSTRRGQYAEKNGAKAPFTNQIDFRITQNLGINAAGRNHRLQITFDIFNVANLINSEWGTIYGNPFAYQLINYEGVADDGTTPEFTFTEDNLGFERYSIADRISRWRARLGVRYMFR